MPLVRMLTAVAGPNFEWRAGDEVEMSPQEAQIWADGERGELVTEERVSTPERGRPRAETRTGPARAPKYR